MNISHKLLFFVNSISVGMIAPVLSLVFLTHGAALETLSLYMGIYAVTVVLFEVPSGIIADTIGRKKVFIISHFFLFFNYLIIIFSNKPFLLAGACILLGMGRAFGSGSIEALEVEQCIDKNGSDSVPKINSLLAAIDSIGLAVGSLCGGFLGYIGSKYYLLLSVLLVLEIFLIVFSVCIIREKSRTSFSLNALKSVKLQTPTLFYTIKSSKTIFTIFVMSIISGILLTTIETYWQPALLLYLPSNLNWILGVVSCLGYFGVSIGTKLGEWLLDSAKVTQLSLSSKRYWILKLLLPAIILSFGFCRKWYLFILLFTTVYIILGTGNLLENTIFHLAIDNANRASMLSVSSLFLRGGGVISSILGSIFLRKTVFTNIWFLLPVIALFMILCTIYFYFNQKNKAA